MSACPQCGSPSDVGETYCRACGALLSSNPSGSSWPDQSPVHNSSSVSRSMQPARHAPSHRRPRSRISPEHLRLGAVAAVGLIMVVAAVMILPGFLQAGTPVNSTGNGSSSWIPVPAVQCSAGQTECSGKCVDLMTDSSNCGRCGFSVPFGESCVGGQFSSVVKKTGKSATAGSTAAPAASGTPGSCPAGRWSCSGACVDPGTDHNNCGSCGTVCPSVDVCENGRCVLPATTVTATTVSTVAPDLSCSRNEISCNGTCTNIFTDRKNCGVCGRACKADESCENARCGPACMDNGTTLCSGICVDLKTDAGNCGSCGTECKSFLPNAKGSGCISGACTISQCSAGYGDCDKNVANGCEVNLRTDVNNCGTCGTKCASGKVCYNKVCSVPVTSS